MAISSVGCLLHRFGTHALRQIVDFTPMNWQPNKCSCVCLVHSHISISRYPRAARRMGVVCRTWGLLRAGSLTPPATEDLCHLLKKEQGLSLSLYHLYSASFSEWWETRKRGENLTFSYVYPAKRWTATRNQSREAHTPSCSVGCALQTPSTPVWLDTPCCSAQPLENHPLELAWNKSTQWCWRRSSAFTHLDFQYLSTLSGPAGSHLCASAGSPGTQPWRESWQLREDSQPCFYWRASCLFLNHVWWKPQNTQQAAPQEPNKIL